MMANTQATMMGFKSAADDSEEDPLLSYLSSTKMQMNLNIVKERELEDKLAGNLNVSTDTDTFNKLLFESSLKQYKALDSLQHLYHHYQESIKKRRYSVDFDSVHPPDNDKPVEVEILHRASNDGDAEELTELRRRLLGRKASEPGAATGDDIGVPTKSIDRQIEDQDNLQQSLLQDMTKLVGTLKQGATAFQNALEEDKNVLNAAEIGVQVASQSLTDISGKLKKYDKKKLGFLFYISAVILMFLGLLATYLIIKVFPAL